LPEQELRNRRDAGAETGAPMPRRKTPLCHPTRSQGAWVHLTARTIGDLTPLRDAQLAWWLWTSLRAAFPKVGAACLMPDHAHTLTFTDDPNAARLRLASVLSGFTRHLGRRRLWEPVPLPSAIADRKHLLRTIRYVHLNPCREGLVRDPLQWPWSTHRGVIGAEVEPWLDARLLASIIVPKRSAHGLLAWFHEYVSGDPSCAPGGTPFPQPAPRRDWTAVALADVVSAAIAATPWSGRKGARRHAAALLAAHQGFRDAGAVARAIGVTRQTARLLATRPAPSLLSAAALCLGDSRLRLDAKHEAALVNLRRDNTRGARAR
jgi:hypothetical protein